MTIYDTDVVVIGGGIAGAVAAKAALDAGARVAVVFPNGGQTEFAPGVVDVAGVIPSGTPRIVEHFAEGAAELAKDPAHPYAKAEAGLASGLGALAGLAAAGGYELAGAEDGANVWLPNVIGTFTPCAKVGPTQAGAFLGTEGPRRVLVVGVRGNAAFDAVAAAQSYNVHQKALGRADKYTSSVIDLPGLAARHRISDGELAGWLDTPTGADEFVAAASAVVKGSVDGFDAVVLPPALGFEGYAHLAARLADELGIPAGEVLSIGNAVAGWRLTRALYAGLEQAEAYVLRGTRVTSVSAEEGGIVAEAVRGITDQLHPGQEVTITAKAAVLATGGFVGGGLEARHTNAWVSVLDIELGQVPAEDISRDFADPQGQAFARWGLAVNDQLQPEPDAYSGRLFAAGSVLAGADRAAERSAAGISAATGWIAGSNAARVALEVR